MEKIVAAASKVKRSTASVMSPLPRMMAPSTRRIMSLPCSAASIIDIRCQMSQWQIQIHKTGGTRWAGHRHWKRWTVGNQDGASLGSTGCEPTSFRAPRLARGVLRPPRPLGDLTVSLRLRFTLYSTCYCTAEEEIISDSSHLVYFLIGPQTPVRASAHHHHPAVPYFCCQRHVQK